MTRYKHLPIILILLVLGCKTTKQSKSNIYPIITFEKTSCMGTCPTFLFMAFPNGTVSYSGKEYVELIGEYSATISKEELATLRGLFDGADFFSFANVYSASIKDIPTTFLYYDNGSQNAKVTDHYGAPESLKKLEAQIEKFINSIEWQKN